MRNTLLDPIDEVVNLFTKHDQAAASGDIKQFSCRASAEVLAYLDAMAWYAEKSRNSMTEVLLRAGIQSVLSKLPSEVIEEIEMQKIALLSPTGSR